MGYKYPKGMLSVRIGYDGFRKGEDAIYEPGAMWKNLSDNDLGSYHSLSPRKYTPPNNFRRATKVEEKAYLAGCRNINNTHYLIYKDTVVVRTKANSSSSGRHKDVGEIFSTVTDSHEGRAYYELSSSVPRGDFRLANEEEIKLFHKGLTNINNMSEKFSSMSQYIGRYVKALKDYPNGGDVLAGDYGRVISNGRVDFSSQGYYTCVPHENLDKYEIMPEGFIPDTFKEEQELQAQINKGLVGRYIKCLKNDVFSISWKKGNYAKIVKHNPGDRSFSINLLSDTKDIKTDWSANLVSKSSVELMPEGFEPISTEGRKFKKGDIIIGNDSNRYSSTRKGVVCVVRDFYLSDQIKVNILGKTTSYTVLESKFDLHEDKHIDFEIGDAVDCTVDGEYSITKPGVPCKVIGFNPQDSQGRFIRVDTLGSSDTSLGYKVYPSHFVKNQSHKLLNKKIWIGEDDYNYQQIQKKAFEMGFIWGGGGGTKIDTQPTLFLKFERYQGEKKIYRGHGGDTTLEGFMNCELPSITYDEAISLFNVYLNDVPDNSPLTKGTRRLTSFPRSGYCESTNSDLIEFIQEFTDSPLRYPGPDDIGVAWSPSSYWFIKIKSSNEQYSIEELSPFIKPKSIPKPVQNTFEIGDLVVINSGSPYYKQGIGADGMTKMEGKIDQIFKGESLPFRVKWSNGSSNVYRASDLILIGRPMYKSGIDEYPIAPSESFDKSFKDFQDPIILSKPDSSGSKIITTGLEFQSPVIHSKKSGTKSKLVTV